MAYNEFTLDGVIQQFGLTVRERTGLFAQAAPLASAIGTKKARSEFIIAPVLSEVLPTVYGIVTTGSLRKFLQFLGLEAVAVECEYYISDPDRILGILVAMVTPTL